MKRKIRKQRTIDTYVGTPCHYCKRKMLSTKFASHPDIYKRMKIISVEHIIPRSKNGTNDPNNLVYACVRCNSLRGSIDYSIFFMFAVNILRKFPDAPNEYLRSALIKFINSLAEIAIQNKRESRRAVSMAINHISKEIKE